MKRLLSVFLALAALTCCLTDMAQEQGKKWALLVGVEEYKNPDVSRLDFAVKDVTDVAAALPALGFTPDHIRLMTSAVKDENDLDCPTNVNLVKALDFLAKKVGSNDTFLLYFTGHGFSKEGQNFLGTINADPASVATLQLSSLTITTLQTEMKKFKARQVIFMIDACRNDPEKGKGDNDNKRTSDFSKSLIVAAKPEGSQIEGSAVLFACSEGERAFEDPTKKHGIFTYYLLEALQGKGTANDGPLTMPDVAEYTRNQVIAWAEKHDRKQTPELLSLGAPKLVLAEKVTGSGGGNSGMGGSFILLKTHALLDIDTNPPGAKVFVDGKDTGKVTPTILDLELKEEMKSFDIKLGLKDYKPLSLRANLVRGKATQISQDLEPAENRSGRLPATRINASDGAEMVLIPAGGFLLGSTEEQIQAVLAAYPDYKPEGLFQNRLQRINLGAYYIYKYPVTVRQYLKFCQETGHATPNDLDDPSHNMDLPIINVSWKDAQDYCIWASKGGLKVSLPTEQQWEKAARGPGGLLYPWGNTWDASKCANSIKPNSLQGTVSVLSHPEGKSFYGVMHMAGNVCQWCLDIYDKDRDWRVIKGSSWGTDEDPAFLRSAIRFGMDPNEAGEHIGFRCVVAVQP